MFSPWFVVVACCPAVFAAPQDLELSVPDRLEKYSGKLVQLGTAVGRLAAAGKKVSQPPPCSR